MLFVDAEWKVDAVICIVRIRACFEVLESSVIVLNPATVFNGGFGKPGMLTDDRYGEAGIIDRNLGFG